MKGYGSGRRSSRWSAAVVIAVGWVGCGSEPQVGSNSSAVTETETAHLVASSTLTADGFGRAMALDGDVLVAGSYHADTAGGSSGDAHIFIRQAGGFVEQAKLLPSDVGVSDHFGNAVAIDGDTVAVAAFNDGPTTGARQGTVWVFTRNGSQWTQQARLQAFDGIPGTAFGRGVAVHADTLVVGASGDSSLAGALYVYTRAAGVWSLEQKLTLPDAAAGDWLGEDVAVRGDTIVASAAGRDPAGSVDGGSAVVFERVGTTWTLAQELTADVPSDQGRFGLHAVAIDGDTITVGNYEDSAFADNSGAVYVFRRSGNGFVKEAVLRPSDPQLIGSFGWSVDIEDDELVVGSLYGRGKRIRSGTAYVFERTGAVWTQVAKLQASDGDTYDLFGMFSAISGGVVTVGAPSADVAGPFSGAVYVFDRNPPPCPDTGNGDWDYCTVDCPCEEGEADCDSDDECADGLRCLRDAGLAYGYSDPEIDVCAPICPVIGVGAGNFCAVDCPCEEGEGDCDGDDECAPGLRCLRNVGLSYGYSDPDLDVCSALCPTEGVGAGNFCHPDCPCEAGEGDCDNDAECAAGLVCVDNVGANYGFDADVDVCEAL